MLDKIYVLLPFGVSFNYFWGLKKIFKSSNFKRFLSRIGMPFNQKVARLADGGEREREKKVGTEMKCLRFSFFQENVLQ